MIDRAARAAGTLVEAGRLDERLALLRERYENAQPFRHVVIDNFLPTAEALAVAGVFPQPRSIDRLFARVFAARSHDVDITRVNERISSLFEMLAAPDFTAWLETLTGIDDLQIDPDFIGAGLHQAVNGSSLPIHADHNTLPGNASLYRRINLLIYMNPVWDARWGGVLELWQRNGKAPVTTVLPLFNRCIIMDVHDDAFHGYRRLRVPRGIARNAVVAYYYAPTPAPQQAPSPHPTIFPAVGASRRELMLQRVRLALLVRVRRLMDAFTRGRSADARNSRGGMR